MSLIRRTLDPGFLTAVANHAQVRPHIGGEGPIELGPLIADPANIAIEAEHGGWLLLRHEAGVFELHTLFLPEGRGEGYFEAAREALTFVFTASEAREIVTRIPASSRREAFAAARCGFVERFTRARAFAGPRGLEAVFYRALSLDAWMFAEPACGQAGRAFHAQLEAAKAAAGSEREAHPDDPAHDAAAGAAALMVRAGNAKKGVWAYNRWARLAGYQPIALLSESPLLIDVGDGVVQVVNGKMEVALCR